MKRRPNYLRGPAEVRFWAKVTKHGPRPQHSPELGPCWAWIGSCNELGYGVLKIAPAGNGKYVNILAHRYAVQLLVGPIPEGLEPDHLCRNPACVKAIADEHGPAHLEIVTHQENTLRGKRFLREARTHCKNGHPWNEKNTRWRADRPGSRECRECANEWSRQRNQRRREATA